MHKSLLLLALTCLFFTACKKNEEQVKSNNSESTEPITISVGKGPDALFLTPDELKLYVANVEGTSISVINTNTDKVTKTIEGFQNPWGITKISNSKIIVSNYGGQVTVVDFQTEAVVGEKTFSTKFGGITSNADGSTLFVIAIPEKKVYKLDATTLDSLDSYDTGNNPEGVELSSNDSLLMVTNTSDGTISIINVNNKSTSLLSPGGKPELIHATKNGSKIYVSNFTLNKVHVLNGLTGQLEQDLEGFDGPEEAVESSDGKFLYVVNFNSSSVNCFEVENYKKLDESHKTGMKPIGVMPLSDNKKIYISNYGENTVSVIEFE